MFVAIPGCGSRARLGTGCVGVFSKKSPTCSCPWIKASTFSAQFDVVAARSLQIRSALGMGQLKSLREDFHVALAGSFIESWFASCIAFKCCQSRDKHKARFEPQLAKVKSENFRHLDCGTQACDRQSLLNGEPANPEWTLQTLSHFAPNSRIAQVTEQTQATQTQI